MLEPVLCVSAKVIRQKDVLTYLINLVYSEIFIKFFLMLMYVSTFKLAQGKNDGEYNAK